MDRSLLMPERRVGSWGVRGLVAAVAFCAAVWLPLDSSSWDYAFDFRLLWLAGLTWQHGDSPYTEAFDAYYAMTFGWGQASWHMFNYPPHFVLLAVPMACLPYFAAAKVWVFVNVGCAALAAWLLAPEPRSANSWGRALGFIGIFAFVLMHYAGGYSLHYGQVSLLVLLGAVLFLRGFAGRSALPLTFGLLLLCMKPNVGLFPGLLVLSRVYEVGSRSWRRWAVVPILVTATLMVAGTLAAIGMAGWGETLGGFVERIGSYAQSKPCAPHSLTGLPYLVDTFAGAPLPNSLSLVCGAAACGYFALRSPSREFAALGVLAATFFFVPLHSYDLIATVALLPLLWTLSVQRAVMVGAALLAIHRCVNFEFHPNPRTWFDDGLFPATLGALVVLCACVGARGRRSSTGSAAGAIADRGYGKPIRT